MFSWIKNLVEPASKQQAVSGLDQPVLDFRTLLGKKTINIPWTLRHAFEGVLVTGASGSGKTSGSGDFLAKAFLEFGMGGLVLCAKPEEAEHWTKLAEQTGRAADLRIVSPEGSYRFNFLEYEMHRQGRGGGITENVVSVLMQCAEIANGPHNRDQDVWERSMKQLLRNSVDLCRLAKEPIKIRTICRIAVEKGFADQLLMQAEALNHSGSDFEDLETVIRFCAASFATFSPKRPT